MACWRCKASGQDRDHSGLCQACHGRGSRFDDVHHLVENPHAQAMISACWTLGGHPELETLRLRPWAHMLGFRGHFSTKSRRYSTTLTALRDARRDWRDSRLLGGLGQTENGKVVRGGEIAAIDGGYEETILVVGHWQYIGRGHSLGEAMYARTIAHDLAENRALHVLPDPTSSCCDDHDRRRSMKREDEVVGDALAYDVPVAGRLIGDGNTVTMIQARVRERHGRRVYDVRLRDPNGRVYNRTFETKKDAVVFRAIGPGT